MKSYNEFSSEFMQRLDDIVVSMDKSLSGVDDGVLTEAGNISSGLAMRKHSNVFKNGKRLLASRDASDADKLLARMLADVAGLCLLSIAVSGGSSGISVVARGAAMKSL